MRNAALSCKVFLGGVPWDITESALFNAFKPFGTIRIEWPGKDNTSIPKGYLYVIFETEKQVSTTQTQIFFLRQVLDAYYCLYFRSRLC